MIVDKALSSNCLASLYKIDHTSLICSTMKLLEVLIFVSNLFVLQSLAYAKYAVVVAAAAAVDF